MASRSAFKSALFGLVIGMGLVSLFGACASRPAHAITKTEGLAKKIDRLSVSSLTWAN